MLTQIYGADEYSFIFGNVLNTIKFVDISERVTYYSCSFKCFKCTIYVIVLNDMLFFEHNIFSNSQSILQNDFYRNFHDIFWEFSLSLNSYTSCFQILSLCSDIGKSIGYLGIFGAQNGVLTVV